MVEILLYRATTHKLHYQLFKICTQGSYDT